MKKPVLFIVLLLCGLSCFAQKASVFLSQENMVSNKDYPVYLKDSIAKIKNDLSSSSAEEIMRNSLILADTTKPGSDPVYIEGGLKMQTTIRVDDGIVNSKSTTAGNIKTTTETNAYHYEKCPIIVPFSQIKFARIKKYTDGRTVEFVTKVNKFKNPYCRANKFILQIKPGANEARLIASILYLCSNIKKSGAINY